MKDSIGIFSLASMLMLSFASLASVESDTEFTRQIRAAIASDPTYSTAAQNVQIITRDTEVIISGKVASKREKDKIEQLVKLKESKKRIFNGMNY
jgi:osmotically-inducible protein OsmY